MAKELTPVFLKLKAWRAANKLSQAEASAFLQDSGLPARLTGPNRLFLLQRGGYNLINNTKTLFSELVYDFQSERWNEFDRP